MRYTEKEYEKEYSGFKGWFSISAALIIAAPLRLLNEISTKIIYLNRKLIQKILNLAAVLSSVCTLVNIILSYLLIGLNVWTGKIPIILQAACSVVLVCVAFGFATYDFVIYKHLSALLPLNIKPEGSSEVVGTTEMPSTSDTNNPMNTMESFIDTKPKQFANLEDDIFTELQDLSLDDVTPLVPSMDISELSAKLSATEYETPNEPERTFEHIGKIDASLVTGTPVEKPKHGEGISLTEESNLDDELFALLNEDLLDDETTTNFRHSIADKIEDLQVISDEELEKNMDESTDPSKYITEDSLFKYLKELGADDFGEFDMFGEYTPSEDFDLYS